MYQLYFTKQAQKDADKISAANLRVKVEKLLGIVCQNPFAVPPKYEKLVGDLSGCYSRRINLKHRLVYQVDEKLKIIKVLRMWTHYE